MMRLLGLLIVFAFTASATAEVIHCQFNDSFQPSSYAIWKTVGKTLTTTVGGDKKQTTYTDIRVFTGLAPYKKSGFTLVAFGDVPALHIKQTGNAHLAGDSENIYEWEAYWGDIPGRLPSNWFEINVLKEIYGPRGACWSKEHPRQPIAHESHGGGDGGHEHCDHKNRGGEKSGNQG